MAAADPEATGAGPVLVVGDVMVDVVTTHSGPIETASDTPARIRLIGGGSAANTACWLAHLAGPGASGDSTAPKKTVERDGQTSLLAAVGPDAFGVQALTDLAAAGVAHVGPVLDAATGACVVLVGPDGERTMLPDRGANDLLRPDHVARAFAAGAPGWVHLSGYTLLGEGSRAAGLAVLAAAGRTVSTSTPVPVSVDAASAAPLRAVGADVFLAWIHGCDLVLANDDEVEALGGEAAVLAHARALVTKHGGRGASWTDGREHISVPGVEVEVVDTTGAGDAFAAAFLVARRRGSDVSTALAEAVAVGARAVAREGARPS